jgi:hypothetical protein
MKFNDTEVKERTNTKPELSELTRQCFKLANDLFPQKDEDFSLESSIREHLARAQAYGQMQGDLFEAWRKDEDNRELFRSYVDSISSMQSNFNIAYALITLRDAGQVELATDIARNMWWFAFTGDSYGEFLWEWCIRNDVPVNENSIPEGSNIEAEKAKLLEWDRVEKLSGSALHNEAAQAVATLDDSIQERYREIYDSRETDEDREEFDRSAIRQVREQRN